MRGALLPDGLRRTDALLLEQRLVGCSALTLQRQQAYALACPLSDFVHLVCKAIVTSERWREQFDAETGQLNCSRRRICALRARLEAQSLP